MKKLLLMIGTILLAVSCELKHEVYYPNAICIENITTIDAENGLKANQTVILLDGIIYQVYPSDSLDLSPDNEIIDGTGKYLIPGLWDAHVHYAYIEKLAPYMSDLFLAYGITSLRDTGGRIDFMLHWKKLSKENPTTTPRLMIAGPLLDGMPNVYDGSSPGRPPLSHGLATVQELENYIDYLDSLEVDLLKAYEMLTPDQFLALMAKAKEKGLPVTGHVPLSMDVATVANAGINSLEHLRNVEMSMAERADQLIKERRELLLKGKNMQGGDLRSSIHQKQRVWAINHPDSANTAAVLEVLAKNQTVQIPTLALSKIPAFKEYMNPEWQESYTYLPDTIEAQWRTMMRNMNAAQPNLARQQHFDWGMKMIGEMHKAGIPIMAGTDTPIGFLTPGLSLHAEIELFVQAGLSPLEALASATTTPAKWFGMEKELGLIQVGMHADLLILDANPLEDIRNTREIKTVIKAGSPIDRDSLVNGLRQ